ncbi:hypothetical protein [Spirosoma harenae]
MAYINLRHIGELYLEALTNYQLAESFCYNCDSKTSQIPDDVFMRLAKAHRQAENLHKKLSRLHQVCTDFAAGQFDAYIDEHTKWKENEEDAFDPFAELESCFDCSSVCDLPTQIEQYLELLSLSHTYAQGKQQKWLAFEQFFGRLARYYPTTDASGRTVMVPESEMPESLLHEQSVNREIQDVEVEFCLDNYNVFYDRALGLISAYMGGDVQECAQIILSLFSPTRAALNL